LGAARLARAAVGGPLAGAKEGTEIVVAPRADWRDAYRRKRETFRKHYAMLRQANSR
jgi:hypothetical protein